MLINEINLRDKYNKNKFKILNISSEDIITPSAREFINKNKIEIVIDNNEDIKEEENEKKDSKENKIKYVGINGESYIEKPEYMTQIHGNVLVLKSNKIIKFRSKLDYFLSELVLTEKLINSTNNKFKEDMESIREFVDDMVRSEVLDKKIEKDSKILGMDFKKLREVSHNPKKYYKMEHLFRISKENKINTLRLNVLRTIIRETEILGVEAYVSERGVEKEDILAGLNKLSSAIYIMMLREESGHYGNK